MMAFSSGVMRYFYPRPPRGRRRENIQCEAKLLAISIHALREEGDGRHPVLCCFGYYFYPRPPRGGRLQLVRGFNSQHKFLSTPSARRATGDVVSAQHIVDISIHALREEGDLDSDIAQIIYKISIHALREEGDMLTLFAVADVAVFLSTPSARRATSFMATCTG